MKRRQLNLLSWISVCSQKASLQRLSMLIALSFLFITNATAEQKAVTIKFALVDIDFNPYQSWQGNHPTGPDPDFIRAILKKLPYNHEILKLPLLRAVTMLEKGQIHMMTLFPDVAKSNFSTFSDIPLHYSNYRLATLMSSDFEFTEFSDLYGKNNIGVVYGNTISKEFDQLVAIGLIEPTRTKDYENVIELLTRGRVNAVAGNEFIIRYFAEKKGVYQKLRFMARPLDTQRPFSIAISKRSPDISANKLTEQINSIMLNMLESGELENIYRNHNLDFEYYGMKPEK